MIKKTKLAHPMMERPQETNLKLMEKKI